jgi:hypothetical protein
MTAPFWPNKPETTTSSLRSCAWSARGERWRKAHLTLSLWNLFEIGSASDRVQQDQRLAFLAKLKPLWILERVAIQRLEVRAFLWREKFGWASEPVVVFKRNLSEVEAYMVGSIARIGVTPRQWIDGTDFKGFDESKDLAPTALRQLQTFGAKKIAERQDEIFRRWIQALLPALRPNATAFSKAEIEEMSKFCEDNQAAFYLACPAMAVENAMTRARTAAATRNPKRSDGIDLMHSVVALAYCDYFAVRDAFTFHCCELVRKDLSGRKLATFYPTAEELKNALT